MHLLSEYVLNLSEVQFRFNRRYDIRAKPITLLQALVAVPRHPEREIRVAQIHG